MAQWVEVINTDQVPEGEKRCILAMNVPLVICRVAGELVRTEERMPTCGASAGRRPVARSRPHLPVPRIHLQHPQRPQHRLAA